jgi:rubrerythrin
MILIAGVSSKTKTIDPTPRLCPSCGLAQAYLKRVDHYVSLFFIPVIRVKKGEPVLVCNRCESAGFNAPKQQPPSESPSVMCKQCGRSLENDFRYCPFCGMHQ